MKSGACPLCQLENQLLCDSHYLPKKVYGVTNAPQLKSPHPVVLSDGGLKQASDQLRGYVFCKACEERLNKGGERWVLKNIPHDYGSSYPLRTALQAITPIFVGPDLDLYSVTGSPAFEMDKILYFGLSVFWRGSVRDWTTTAGLKAPKVELCVYGEPIRKFLRGEQLLPEDVVLTVDLWHAKTVLQASYAPTASHLHGCQRYWFYIPGLIFSLYFGANIPSDIRSRDARRNIVGVDVSAIKSIFEMSRSQIRRFGLSAKMTKMLEEVRALRTGQSPTK